MEPSDPAIAEMWDKYRAHYPDPQRPIHSALMEGCVRRLERLLVISPASDDTAGWRQVLPEFYRLTSELEELRSYVGENPLLVPSPPGRLGEFLIEQGFSFAQAQHAVESAAKTLAGRPTSARVRAVKALEVRKLEGLSWRRLAKRLCPCGNAGHDEACVQRIRQAVLGLQDALERLHIILP
jgi:hypothetical protein